jgi:hypothetical protein
LPVQLDRGLGLSLVPQAVIEHTARARRKDRCIENRVTARTPFL